MEHFLKKEIEPVVSCILLSGFVIWWYFFLNPYMCIFYREQCQMFLLDYNYLLQYLILPGGLTSYLASFLIQFFYFPLLGVLFYLGIFLCFYAVIKAVLKKFSLFNHSFFIAFIPGLLFLPASINLLFDPADELAVIIALYGFITLTKLMQNRFYYFLIPLTITVSYLLVGGNVLLTLILFILYSLYIQPNIFLKKILIGILSLIIPVIIWYFFYMVSFKASCFSLTHFRYPDSQLFDSRGIAWFSVIIVPIIGMLLKKIRVGKKWILICNTVLAVILLIMIVKQRQSHFENVVRMGFDAENHQWEDIIKLNRKTTVSQLNCYYTNLALQKKGMMAEKMFQYDQIGISGLVVYLKDHFSCYARSELFFQLGWINPVLHSVYESMSGYSYIKEPNIRNMKRLTDCAIIRQDNPLLMKYDNILNRTLFYRNYTERKDVRANYPQSIGMKNMLINNIPAALETILEDNIENQAVFEYLMAYYLLERDYEKAKSCYDRYFSFFSYSHIPTHYAEFLLLYKRLNNLDDSFYEQYPVSIELRERFDMVDTMLQSTMTRKIQQTLEDFFKNTYWFYVKFPLVQVQTTQKDEKYIY